MYEISLVPDVKSELIKRLKLRNFVIFVCIIVAAACGGVFLILLGITGGQGLTLSAQDTEIKCRMNGDSKCEAKYGTAIKRTNNLSELLSIQSQVNSIEALSLVRVKTSRAFDILATILPNFEKKDSDDVRISEFAVNTDENTLSFEGIGRSDNNIHYRALEAFRKRAEKTYYDYGRYMRLDNDTHEYVEIPSFCIDDVIDPSTGIAYGIYHKGAPGCEAPMVTKEESSEKESDKENGGSTISGDDDVLEITSGSSVATINDESSTVATGEEDKTSVVDIWIRRTYVDANDREEYKSGNDRYKVENREVAKGYYFESACLQYDGNGKYSESLTLETCPLLADSVEVSESAYGKDNNDELVLSFSATLYLTHDVFLAKNNHMLIASPTRQNVTDSYVQVQGMFEEAVKETEEDK